MSNLLLILSLIIFLEICALCAPLESFVSVVLSPQYYLLPEIIGNQYTQAYSEINPNLLFLP